MTANDIRQAAERLRQTEAPTLWNVGGIKHISVADHLAAWTLACAYLAACPADSDQPVTADWLLANGWTQGVHWPWIELAGGDLLEWRGAGLWVGETAVVLARSRGQVRQLVAALKGGAA